MYSSLQEVFIISRLTLRKNLQTKSIAQLKRDADSGEFFAKCFMRCGEWVDYVPLSLHMQGYRKLVASNSNGVFFYIPKENRHDLLNKEQEKSLFVIPRSDLVVYTDKALITYKPGYREPTDNERLILDAIEDKPYYSKDHFLYKFYPKYIYLNGYTKKYGCKLDINRKKLGFNDYVLDEHIRGEVDFIYRICSNDEILKSYNKFKHIYIKSITDWEKTLPSYPEYASKYYLFDEKPDLYRLGFDV